MGKKIDLAVGFFDGVHRGHQRILSALLAHARETSATPAVLTFTNHPISLLAPAKAPPLLMTVADRLAAIRAFGVPSVTALDFTAAFAAQTPVAFAEFLRTRFPGLDRVYCGANWHFGVGGRGNAAALRSFGIDVEVVPFAEYDDVRVSSTRIRLAMERGKLAAAAEMLGRPPVYCGFPVKGKAVGTTLGFPTINVPLVPGLVAPPFGVYAVSASTDAADSPVFSSRSNKINAVANIGLAPTFGTRAWVSPVIEVHFFEQPDDFAGHAVAIALQRFIRPERIFPDETALKEQIARDIKAAQR